MKNALLVRRAVEDGEELQAALRTRGSSENVVCEILDKNRNAERAGGAEDLTDRDKSLEEIGRAHV